MLLKLIRCYLKCDIYASFELHTMETIEAYHHTVQRFYDCLEVHTQF